MKTTLLLFILVLSLTGECWAQQPASGANKMMHAAPCAPRSTSRKNRCSAVQPAVVAAPVETSTDFFVGEAVVDVTKDQAVVRLAMAQHASVLIELPANDGPRYIIPGDPEMVTVDEKALERNKRAIIVRPGSLFIVPTPNQRKGKPAATVTAQMRSGLVVTFLFYPVADLAQNVHRCVLSYQRDEVVARRRAAGLPVNLDQKEQGGEKTTEQFGAPASLSIEPDAKEREIHSPDQSNNTPAVRDAPKPPPIEPANMPVISTVTVPKSTNGPTELTETAAAAARNHLARVRANPGVFNSWTKPLHGLALAVQQDADLNQDCRVLLLAVRNAGLQPLKIVPGTPELILEMHDDKGKVINVQSVTPLHIEVSDTGNEVAAGQTVYYAIAFRPPLMGVRHSLKILVAQANAADEPASIGLLK